MSTKSATKPALCGAYAVIDCYGSIAVPVEMVQFLGDALRIDSKYEEGKSRFVLNKSQEINFKLITSEQMTAMKVAHKLEE
jgi:hypothetical protein